MTALHEIDEITARIESETFALQLHLATRMIGRATLELRYARQPRLPTGDPGGGQYTFGGSATGSGTPSSTHLMATGLGRQTFSGYLTRQNYVRAENAFYCTYYDSRQDYQFTRRWVGTECPQVQVHF